MLWLQIRHLIHDRLPYLSAYGHCARPPDAATLNFSLMDNYFSRGGRAVAGGPFTLKEFCVRSNHDPDAVNYQTTFNHKSCWETIAAHPKRSATAPAGLPNATAPSTANPTFPDESTGLRLIVVIDSSGSMADDNKLVNAKSAASLLISFLQVGDQLGVVSFADSPTLTYPLTQITSAQTQSSAVSAINGLTAYGSTDMGDALSTALSQITGSATRSCNELIVLVTDGDYNVGPDPRTVASTIADQGIAVLTVGVGSSISSDGQSVLQDVASSTGGKYFGLSSSFGLLGLFFQISAEANGTGLLARAPLALAPNAQQDTPAVVEQGAQSVTFGVALSDTNANVSISLKAPNNTTYATDASVMMAGGTVRRDVPGVVLYTFPNPQTGTWHIVALSGVATNIEVFAQGVNNTVTLLVSMDQDTVQAPAAITLEATPQYNGVNVTSMTVAGVVLRPDGSSIPVTLYDDGDPVKGDTIPNDGIFRLKFNSYTTNGTYTANLTASGTGAFAQGEAFGATLGTPTPAPSFSRASSRSFTVTGIDPCAVSPTPLTLNVPQTATLSSLSCQNSLNGNYTAIYSFAGNAGQAISISLSSSAFDTYLYLLNPSGTVLAQDDDSGGGTNSRIPSTGTITLPSTGIYKIYATGYSTSIGQYTLVVNGTVACTQTLGASSIQLSSSAGIGTVDVSSNDSSCVWTASTTSNWINISGSASGTGNGTVSFAVMANTGAARSGTITIGNQVFTVNQSGAGTGSSVAPNAGAGNTQTFTFSFNNQNGVPDINGAQIVLNSSLTGVNSCYILFGQPNLITLAGDNGTTFTSTTAGVPAVLQNSQCIVLPSLSSTSASGNTLILKLTVVFRAGFAGPKNIWTNLSTASSTQPGGYLGWVQVGSWTAQGPASGLAATSVTRSLAPDVPAQSFTFSFFDPFGAPDISGGQIVFNTAINGVNACYVLFNANNVVSLADDSGTPGPAVSLGTPTVLQNSQCSVYVGNSYQTQSGQNLSITLFIAFKPAFAGTKNIYSSINSNAGTSSGFTNQGTYVVPSTPPALGPVQVSQLNSTGASQVLTFVYADPNGVADITSTQVIVNPTQTTNNSCVVTFTRANATLALTADNGTGSTSAAIGAPGALQNSQCIVNTAASSQFGGGNHQVLTLFVTMKSNVTENIYSSVTAGGTTSAVAALGSWTVTSPSSMTPISVAPFTGAATAGTLQPFTFNLFNPAGATDISGALIVLYPSLQGVGACYILWGHDNNLISLASDNAQSFTSATAGTPGMLTNSQCTVDTSQSFSVQTANTVNLTIAVKFNAVYQQFPQLYSWVNVQNALHQLSGWSLLSRFSVR